MIVVVIEEIKGRVVEMQLVYKFSFCLSKHVLRCLTRGGGAQTAAKRHTKPPYSIYGNALSHIVFIIALASIWAAKIVTKSSHFDPTRPHHLILC